LGTIGKFFFRISGVHGDYFCDGIINAIYKCLYTDVGLENVNGTDYSDLPNLSL